MKAQEIEIFETGESCFGDLLRINGKNYEDFDQSEITEFIQDMLANDINKDILIREVCKTLLEALQFEAVEWDSYSCEQCGNSNSYFKYKKTE